MSHPSSGNPYISILLSGSETGKLGKYMHAQGPAAMSFGMPRDFRTDRGKKQAARHNGTSTGPNSEKASKNMVPKR